MHPLLLHLNAWEILLAIGILLIVGEIFVSGFILLPLGLSFLLTALLAVFVQNWAILLFTLAVLEVGVFVFFKKALRPYHGKTKAYTNAEGMVGQECEVVETIPANGMGYVKLYGDQWQAKSLEDKPLKAGLRVIITKIDGNKVQVEPMNKTEEM